MEIIISDTYEQLSKAAADVVAKTLNSKPDAVLGLATGSTPLGLYKELIRMHKEEGLDFSQVTSFNLDEYVGLPGQNAQQRVMHPESYCYFMIQEFFGLLHRKFIESNLPYGSLIDQEKLITELKTHPADWRELGKDAGKWIHIKARPVSEYLAWVRNAVLVVYAREIRKAGGIDLHIIGVGGRGHVAFHESGIPFKGSQVMLVKLDDNTVANAVADGHFPSEKNSPRYAVTMGAELVYQAKTVVLLASGERKVQPVKESLLDDPTPDVPISYGQNYSQNGGHLIYVVDETAGRGLLANKKRLKQKGITVQARLSSKE